MASFNRTFVDAMHRNMNCPVCGVTLSVAKRIGNSAEASRNKLRMDMVAHLKANHAGSKFIAKFGGDILMPNSSSSSNGGAMDEGQIRRIMLNIVDELGLNDNEDSGIDMDALRALVKAEVKKFPPQNGVLEIRHVDSKVPITIKRHHAVLKEVLDTIGAGFKNLLLVGPAGTGKTTIAEQVAVALSKPGEPEMPFGFISFSAGITEGSLIGRINSLGKYLPSMLATMMTKPGVFLLDEIDRADPNVILIMNALLEQGVMATPTGVILKRHKRFIILAAGNTWGTGADWMYVGANQLDAATLSRFAGAVIEVGYDEGLERLLTADLSTWFDIFVLVRNAANAGGVRRVLGTRELLAGQKLLKAGKEPEFVWKRLTAGWTADERRKAKVPTFNSLTGAVNA
jgi:MoxR-like ATPase